MRRLRRVLPWAAVAGLLLQVAMGGVSLSVMATAGDTAGPVVCTCFHGADDHGECPMHHTASGQARCRVRGMDDVSTAALATLLAALAAPAASAGQLAPAPAVPGALAALVLPPAPSFSPDLPPPRL